MSCGTYKLKSVTLLINKWFYEAEYLNYTGEYWMILTLNAAEEVLMAVMGHVELTSDE